MNRTSQTSPQADRQQLKQALLDVAGGSKSALGEVYSRTRAKLYGICLRILGDRGEAEDALQDIYVNVWRNASSFDPQRASPITWLATLARNRAIDRLRSAGRSRRTVPIEEAAEQPDEREDAFTTLAGSQERVRLMACVEQLEQRQSSAIRAAFFDGLTYPELAERTEVPLGTMKSWIRRGLLRLRECLER